MRQWEIMNRFKNAEIHNEFKEKLRLQKERKINEYKEDILKLWKERSDREAQERADTRYFYGELAERKLRDADNKLLTHANKLLEEAAKHGRPDFALHKAIDRYCKLYRLYPMPALPASLQEHHPHYAPWDGSAPDPGTRTRRRRGRTLQTRGARGTACRTRSRRRQSQSRRNLARRASQKRTWPHTSESDLRTDCSDATHRRICCCRRS
ncbi:uncharacterized protein LOC119188899 [Manduca sexta]|uniref:uncharacterized protein LOC119188899 n=1 Tax=Manduca sexta TaxID=7130 RepID=UPI00188F9655|nr:uncharacterized protein LOC119188899 [Manduca sexta]